MPFVFEIVHPAHALVLQHVIMALDARRHQTTIVARDKDVRGSAHECQLFVAAWQVGFRERVGARR
jgi:hypothetical protein